MKEETDLTPAAQFTRAVQCRNITSLKQLIEQGFSTDSPISPYNSQTPLGLAIKNDDASIVAVLLQNGADPKKFITKVWNTSSKQSDTLVTIKSDQQLVYKLLQTAYLTDLFLSNKPKHNLEEHFLPGLPLKHKVIYSIIQKRVNYKINQPQKKGGIPEGSDIKENADLLAKTMKDLLSPKPTIKIKDLSINFVITETYGFTSDRLDASALDTLHTEIVGASTEVETS